MRVVGFLPVRGGSKSIPKKNIRRLCGRPLLFWTLDELLETCDEVYVCTDSDEIKAKVSSSYVAVPSLRVIDRPIETASDDASSESALLDFCRRVDSEVVVFAQATSPLIEAKYIREGIKILSSGFDSVLSVVRQKRFTWETHGQEGLPSNYNPFKRPRRQNFDGYLVENGSFYISSRSAILESKCRISGRVGLVEMPEETYFEIDEPTDWVIVEDLMKQRMEKSKVLSRIELLVLDIDGVFTDGSMYYSNNGEAFKRFNTKDGMAVQIARENGITVAIITGESSDINLKRMQKLKVDHLLQGITDKYYVLKKLVSNMGISFMNTAYVGDDINDEACLLGAGMSFAPSDAEEKAKKSADFLLSRMGGSGAVREAVERIIEFNKRNGG